MATPVAPLTTEQKVVQSISIVAGAASQVAAVWGHETLSSLISEVPELAPVVAGFADAILASLAAKNSTAKAAVVSK
jgi:hypothetical protein